MSHRIHEWHFTPSQLAAMSVITSGMFAIISSDCFRARFGDRIADHLLQAQRMESDHRKLWSLSLRAREKHIDVTDGKLSSSLWSLIDGCNFALDAIPGRWPYTDPSDADRYLKWALDHVRTLQSIFSPDLAPA